MCVGGERGCERRRTRRGAKNVEQWEEEGRRGGKKRREKRRKKRKKERKKEGRKEGKKEAVKEGCQVKQNDESLMAHHFAEENSLPYVEPLPLKCCSVCFCSVCVCVYVYHSFCVSKWVMVEYADSQEIHTHACCRGNTSSTQLHLDVNFPPSIGKQTRIINKHKCHNPTVYAPFTWVSGPHCPTLLVKHL